MMLRKDEISSLMVFMSRFVCLCTILLTLLVKLVMGGGEWSGKFRGLFKGGKSGAY
jgi:hypothetical protein